ncbi:MAG: hypothetical protein ACOX8T_12455 [Bacillota bacterium]|jgi:hypothetical protein
MTTLQDLALYLRNLSWGDKFSHDITWSLCVASPKDENGNVLFIGAVITDGTDVSFLFDEARGIHTYITFINNNLVEQEDEIEYDDFKARMQALFGVKKFYKEQ